MEVNNNYGEKKKNRRNKKQSVNVFNHKDKHLKLENWFGQN